MSRSIADITPLTLLDFPDKVACIFWMNGCNLSCRYCYNVSLAKGTQKLTLHQDYLEFLRERVGFLDGVVLSGGECTLCSDLIPLCRQIKELGYLIKIDTNGTQPQVIAELVCQQLCDYIALDYKAPRHLFGHVTGRPELFDAFSQTLDFLIVHQFPFEVRTTIHTDLLDEHAVNLISADLLARGYRGTYYLQYFFDTGSTLGELSKPIRPFNLSLVNTAVPVGVRNFF